MDDTYLDFLHCKTPEEVYRKVREWTSNLSEEEHLVRSTILDIHANIELLLKKILFQHMLGILRQNDNEQEDAKSREKLEKAIGKMGFLNMYRLLKPCLDSFSGELIDIGGINNVRNQVTHLKSIDEIKYKGKNPFKNSESFAQLYSESWVVSLELNKFCSKMIIDPRGRLEYYEEFYYKNHDNKDVE